MESLTMSNYDREKEFPLFLRKLRAQDQLEWRWLLDYFRGKVKPYLFKIDGNLPVGTIVSVDEFIEEVFANSLYRFYELFAEGEFQTMAELRSMMYRIAEFKLKEGYNKVKRDKLIYFTEDLKSGGITEKQDDLTVREMADKELIEELRTHIELLKEEDKEILTRFSKGEELGSIARNLNIEPAACRKRKQRAIEKLKEMVMNGLKRFD